MATDTQAMGLLIRMMPLMQREFALRIEPAMFFDDSGYRSAILDNALQSAEPRLVTYAQQMRERMAQIGAGPVGALRSAAPATPIARAAPAAEPEPEPRTPPSPATDAPRKYVGRLR